MAGLRKGQDSAKAQKAIELEQQAERKRLSGDSAGAQSLLDQRDGIIGGNENSPEALKMRARIDLLKKQTTTRFAPNGNVQAVAAMESEFQNKFGGIKDLKSSEKAGYENTKKAFSDAVAEFVKAGGILVKTQASK